MKFAIPAEEAIQTYELVFLLLFAVGMMSFVNWVVMQYPFVGITLAIPWVTFFITVYAGLTMVSKPLSL